MVGTAAAVALKQSEGGVSAATWHVGAFGSPRHVDNISCTFSNECKLVLLLGCPRFRDSVQGPQQWLVVSQQLELAALQSIPEVTDGGEGGQQLPVKSGILTLRCGQLLGEKAKWPPTVYLSLLQDTLNVVVRCIGGQQQLRVGQWVGQWHCRHKSILDG